MSAWSNVMRPAWSGSWEIEVSWQPAGSTCQEDCRHRQDGSSSTWSRPICFKAKVKLRVRNLEVDDNLVAWLCILPTFSQNPQCCFHPAAQSHHFNHWSDCFTNHLSNISDCGSHLNGGTSLLCLNHFLYPSGLNRHPAPPEKLPKGVSPNHR